MTTTASQNTLIDEAADAILVTRDFCGNEREAAREVFADNGVAPTDELVFQAVALADKQWEQDRLAAKRSA